MSQHYLFHQAGVIPGIPGTFANCRVEVTDDGGLLIGPLYSDFAPSITTVEADTPTDVASEPAPPEPSAEPEPPITEPISPPVTNGG